MGEGVVTREKNITQRLGWGVFIQDPSPVYASECERG